MASWTEPRSANIGDVYTAAWYNTDTRDNVGAIIGQGVVGQPVGSDTKTPGANVASYVRVWTPVWNPENVNINIAASAGNVDLAIYTESAGAPLTRLWSRGSIASPGTGRQSFAISAGSPSSIALPGGPVWLAVGCGNVGFQIHCTSFCPNGLAKTASAAFPLAATAPSTTDDGEAIAITLT